MFVGGLHQQRFARLRIRRSRDESERGIRADGSFERRAGPVHQWRCERACRSARRRSPNRAFSLHHGEEGHTRRHDGANGAFLAWRQGRRGPRVPRLANGVSALLSKWSDLPPYACRYACARQARMCVSRRRSRSVATRRAGGSSRDRKRCSGNEVASIRHLIQRSSQRGGVHG